MGHWKLWRICEKLPSFCLLLPWWNGECRAAINKRKAAFRRFSKVSSAENYEKFSESIGYGMETKELWDKINILNGKHKSEQVNTLLVNKEMIIISRVPKNHTETLINELKDIGCLFEF